MSPGRRLQPDRAASLHVTHQNVNFAGKKRIPWGNATKDGAVGESTCVSEAAVAGARLITARDSLEGRAVT